MFDWIGLGLMKSAIAGLFVLMLMLHQDFWLWNTTETVLGFIPWGLFYHAGYSVAVAILAALTIRFAWPATLEQWAEDPEDERKEKKLPDDQSQHERYQAR